MSSNVNQRRKNPARTASTARLVLAVSAALACVVLAACGSSKGSSTATTTASAASSASTSATGASGRAGSPGGGPTGRFAELRECLAKNGVTLPRPSGGRGAFFLGGGPNRGAFRGKDAQLRAAMKKCGALGGLRFGARSRRFGSSLLSNNPAFKRALTKYAGCLRANGVNVPTPNFSGKGPVFNTAHINTASAQFRSAQVKCRGMLRAGGL
jgi:hypothetical protein